MAQNARVAALTDELIHSIINFDPDTNKQAYKRAKDLATRSLRAHQYARTNQFDVRTSFTGLDEKFRVLNRDDLADALGERVSEIYQRQSKWVPEFLSLLLQLSDRPTENADVAALELLRPPTPPPELTWKQILEDDPYSDEDIWKDIDYRGDSSEEDVAQAKEKKKKKKPSSSSTDDESTYDPEVYILPVDSADLKELEEAQFWKHETTDGETKVEILELQAVRETLFMLAGLQTSLYHTDKQNNNIRVNQQYVLGHAIQKTTDHLIAQLADIGREIYRLRQWTKRSSSLPLIQTFEAAVRRRLEAYDRMLASLQTKYLVPEVPVAVSLLEVHDRIRTNSQPLLRLARLVAEIEPQLLVNPFAHLEILFDQISLAQMTSERDVFEFLSHIFFECLQTYLKPIRRWMVSGDLGLNDETFFVFENDSGSEASSLWHDRFVLRRGKENALRSPSFLQPAAQKIFNTGKSVVFLKELGIHRISMDSSDVEIRLDHGTVCGASSEMLLSPFPELFQAAFQNWIGSKYSLASTILRKHLFTQCGLMSILNDFKILYLSSNGSVFQDFADAVFERMDEGRRGWNDRFLLTELARGIFSPVLSRTRADKVVVRSMRTKSHGQSVKGLGNLYLDYALPWPVMNIIQRSSIPIYQQIFTLLLQTYRTKYLVQRVSLQSIQRTSRVRFRQLSYKLRQRLVWFADIVRSYLTETVIGLSTEDMVVLMQKSEDIDEMSNIHMKYVARLQDQALLSENLKPIHRAVIQLLDLGIAFSGAHSSNGSSTQTASGRQTSGSRNESSNKNSKSSKLTRRKSFIPAIVEDKSSDSDGDSTGRESAATSKAKAPSSFETSLDLVDKEFDRLLPFITVGLRSVGRVGAEPVWEMLAERLDWERKKGVQI